MSFADIYTKLQAYQASAEYWYGVAASIPAKDHWQERQELLSMVKKIVQLVEQQNDLELAVKLLQALKL
jgi:hypothetical protein